MSAKDTFHNTVKEALIKQEWIITHDALHLKIGKITLYIDLGAEKILHAEKNGKQIAIEIKSFLGKSNVHDFHCAVGQFIHYRMILDKDYPDYTLYLAVPKYTYNTFFQLPMAEFSIKVNKLKLLIYDIKKKEIIKWIN